jgi:processive 1,2-diacylglycerol beta-glucosyltransferase
VTASVGGGHNGAACELNRRLTERGVLVAQLDLLALAPWVGALTTAAYVAMLRWAPWSYQLLYLALNRSRVLARLASYLLWAARRRLIRVIPPNTGFIVSTYPMASQLLGQLRRRKRLTAPVATFLTDFSVHRLWIAAGVDMHLAIHQVPAGQARRQRAANVVVSGPLVRGDFRPLDPLTRDEVRRQYRLPADERLALLVGGSWGVGDIAQAARDVARTGQVVPVVVCGQNATLRRRLEADGIRHCLGWVDDMPRLLGAVDVLVQNAGGLTSLESFAAGVPVLSYRCIPGHGRSNAKALAEAGLACAVRRESDLVGAVTAVLNEPCGAMQRATGLRLSEFDPADVVLDCLSTPPLVVPLHRQPHQRPVRRLAVAAAMTAALGWWAGTYGTELAVAHGLNSVERAEHGGIYLIVHSDAALDQQTITMMQSLNAALAVDLGLLERQPGTVRGMAAAGIVLVNAGRGRPYHTGFVSGRTAIGRTASQIRRAQGSAPRLFLTADDLDAIDVGAIAASHERIVVPDERAGAGRIPALHPGDILLLECTGSQSCRTALALVGRQVAQLGLQSRSLKELNQ